MSRSPKRPARPPSRSSTADVGVRATTGPTQRQLRAGELVRHALVEVLRDETLADPALETVSVTLTEVRMSPDLRHALCFILPLGGEHTPEVVAALNRATRFLRGRLGRMVELKFTPELKFVSDDSFTAAEQINRLFDDPRVRRDLAPREGDDGERGGLGDDDGA
jgi:ribosome-binding factor A